MNGLLVIRLLGLVILGIGLLRSSANAAMVDVSATVSPEPVIANSLLTYTINITNVSGVTLTNLVVTNTVSGAFSYNSANTNRGPVVLTNGTLRFLVNRFTNATTLALTFDGRPTALGGLTNLITLTTTNGFLPQTNLSVTSTVVAGISDVAIGVTPPSGSFVQNDQLTFRLDVTNQGPNTVTNLALAARFPAGATVRSITPSNATFSATSTNASLIIGTLANNGVSSFDLTLEPTNSGTFSFSGQVVAATFSDANTTNSVSTAIVTIQAPVAATLTTSFLVLTQQFSPQTGLMTQKVRLTNTGGSPIAAARVIVAGLTNRGPNGLADRLMNAVGTNGGLPFVLYAATLNPASSVDLTLEFFFPSRTPYTNLVVSAIAVPAVTNTVNTTGQSILLKQDLALQIVLIEFAAVAGHRYLILYNETGSLTNWNVAQPSVVATGNRVQWIDEGPPKTLSAPSFTGNRFYRVIESP